MHTDTERLDFLQKLNDKRAYTGLAVLRNSTTGRGWRLHETSGKDSCPSVRCAIDNFMESERAKNNG